MESILFVAAASFMVLARAKTGNLGKREFVLEFAKGGIFLVRLHDGGKNYKGFL